MIRTLLALGFAWMVLMGLVMFSIILPALNN